MASASNTTKCSELSRNLKRKSENFKLLKNSKVRNQSLWNKFRLIEKDGALVTGFATCSECFDVFLFQNPRTGDSYGTKSLHDHLPRCNAATEANQPRILGHVYCQLGDRDKGKLKTMLAKLICEANLPFRFVEHPAFHRLIQHCVETCAKRAQSFNVAETFPSRNTIASQVSHLASGYTSMLKPVLAEPAKFGAVSLSCDMYTDDHLKRAYLDVHAFWVDSQLNLQHRLLAVRHFGSERHTGVNIASKLGEILREFDLNAADLIFITDRGANMVKAIDELDRGRIDCANHRLHTAFATAWIAAKASHPLLANYENSIVDLCNYVKNASGVQEQLPKSLKHGGDTRPWTAIYRRADALNESYQELLKIFAAQPDKLSKVTAVDYALNAAILEFTRPVAQVFAKLEASNSPTLFYVIPAYYLLAKKCCVMPADPAAVAELKQALLQNLDVKYFTSIKATHWIATFLHPEFMTFSFMPEDAFKARTLKDLTSVSLASECATVLEVEVAQGPQQVPVSTEPQLPSIMQPDASDPFEYESPCAPPNNEEPSTYARELLNYRAKNFLPLPPDKHDPLLFWKRNAAEFPLFSKVARRIFCTPASSAVSERDFSSVGLTITDLRSRLRGDRVEAIQLVKAGSAANMF